MSQLSDLRNKERDIPQSSSLSASVEDWGNFASGVHAPPVDRELVTRFANNQLDGDEQQQAIQLVGTYRSWRDALREVLEDQRRG